MKWNFFKTNWFPIAVIVLVLAAIVKKNLLGAITNTGKAGTATEKLTGGGAIASAGESHAGILSWASRTSVALPDIPESVAIPFLQRFGRVAAGEQQKFGVPASIMLACAYVNSFSGQRDWARQYHNYFALGCTSDWPGASETVGGACIRRYERAWDSFRDFSVYLSGRSDFAALRQSCGKDWKAWAKALHAKKVSDVSDFEAEVVKVIEAYRLYELDK
jgi:flagellum-specific peptidoglycan hydrolase FlgJ